MATWTGVITNGGAALLTEWVNEQVLHFDRAAAGEGTVDVVALLAQTALVSQKQAISILGSEQVETGIRLKMRIQAASSAFTMHQIGVWASVGDGGSVMIALFQHQTGISIPSQIESPDFAYTFYALVSCSNTGEWTVNVDSSVFVNHEDLHNALDALTAEQIGAISVDEKGQVNGVATLDGSGKVPSSQLPPMDYDPNGTADSKVKAHNNDEASHPHLLEQIGACETAVQKAQDTADQALEAVGSISSTINSEIATHNNDKASHPYLLNQIGSCSTAVQNAQNTANNALEAVNKIAVTIKAIPTQSGNITYNGASQSPAWNGYDSNAMTIGGTTSGTNAGTYNATFTPKAGYKWSDGSTSTKTVSWKIGNAAVKLLWSGANLMGASQVVQLLESVDSQESGIVLHWQAYEDGSAKNWDHVYTFVPKHWSANGWCSFMMSTSTLSIFAVKTVAVSNTKLTGLGDNTKETFTGACGIKSTPTHWALTEVIGV